MWVRQSSALSLRLNSTRMSCCSCTMSHRRVRAMMANIKADRLLLSELLWHWWTLANSPSQFLFHCRLHFIKAFCMSPPSQHHQIIPIYWFFDKLLDSIIFYSSLFGNFWHLGTDGNKHAAGGLWSVSNTVHVKTNFMLLTKTNTVNSSRVLGWNSKANSWNHGILSHLLFFPSDST